jgi:hypothetical protein
LIQPSQANTWTFKADGTVRVTTPDPTEPPAGGTYAWTSDDTMTMKLELKTGGQTRAEEIRFVVKSIDDAVLLIDKPAPEKREPTRFTRIKP